MGWAQSRGRELDHLHPPPSLHASRSHEGLTEGRLQYQFGKVGCACRAVVVPSWDGGGARQRGNEARAGLRAICTWLGMWPQLRAAHSCPGKPHGLVLELGMGLPSSSPPLCPSFVPHLGHRCTNRAGGALGPCVCALLGGRAPPAAPGHRPAAAALTAQHVLLQVRAACVRPGTRVCWAAGSLLP